MTELVILCVIVLVTDIALVITSVKLMNKNREQDIQIKTTVEYVDNIDKKMKDMDKSFERIANEYKDIKRDNTFLIGELHRMENMLVTLNHGFPIESKM